ncbi:putative 5-formyltetrahydrofolate cyclo-ligase [Phaeomoniella chlamydospora]|uniref:Putative 5-formyltetrahydrofolate cyclo-ligase n=1 Tax=Phaeomoniella chlamydospora TaxID=158046 RepID=A0A0G2DZJ8_PHACM|nr:putative 5-formyltetrahydrofolate cyclo-ligase [Phaeomoniella chlamydospora]
MASTSTLSASTVARKAAIRAQIGPELRKVALPDSRFHYDFSSFITDFRDSTVATSRLISHPAFKAAKVIFITPDNCLEELRLEALNAGKIVLVTTYSIRRGFWLLDPAVIKGDIDRLKASLLDTMEKVGRHVTLQQMKDENLVVDLLVTGTGAVDTRTGIRFGKGHGFFDLEWAILSTLGMIRDGAQVVGFCHDCQVVDEGLEAEQFDTVCDLIVTPGGEIEVTSPQDKPTCGIMWERLESNMLDDIPPLRELQEMQGKKIT